LGYESRHDHIRSFAPGIHAVSNGDFDEPWPKVEALKAALGDSQEEDEALLKLLGDDRLFPDDRLPSTGVPLPWERWLSSIFIRTTEYGTRASTLLRLGADAIAILEQRFCPEGPSGRSAFNFKKA